MPAADPRLERLYDACAARALGMLVRVVHDRALAEDLLQEAFVRVAKHVGEVADDRALATYLYRAAVRLGIDALRSGRRAAVATAVLARRAATEPRGPGGEDAVEGHDLAARARRALDDLPPRARAAVLLRVVAGLPLADVGEALSLTDRGAARLVREGLARVRRRLASTESFRDLVPKEDRP